MGLWIRSWEQSVGVWIRSLGQGVGCGLDHGAGCGGVD